MPVLNQNQNQNQAIGMAAGAEGRFRPRYNTDLYPMLGASTPGNPPIVVPAPPTGGYATFHPNWDAELQASMYVDDFLKYLYKTYTDTTTTPPKDWRTHYKGEATTGRKPPQTMSQDELNDQVLEMLQWALEREDRFAEIIDQDDADGAINYWLGMLKVDPARHPATYLMLRLGRRIGEHVVMCLKGDFLSPRPSQLCPWIVPMIDPPVTPSFPAGHAVQAYLNSYLLAYSLPKIPQQPNPLPDPPTLPPSSSAANSWGPLFELAERVSQNRIVAGIHYPVDIEAGKAIALACFADLRNVSSVWDSSGNTALNRRVKLEFPQYA